MAEQPTAQLDKPAIALSDPWLGRVVAERYRVLEKLGEGGMGVVYVAEQLSLQKKVALKLIHPHWAANTELLLRFKREALTTAQLDHPFIASATDVGVLDDGSAFMVMPWVRGRSLQSVMDTQGKMDMRRAARLAAQIADALSAAHAVGIIHRDLKPDNVLVETRTDGSESVKVLDFGIASLSGDTGHLPADIARPLTRAGSVLGTPGYMAPEQASGAEIDTRTDLYALGVILWEACQGASLFPGQDISQIFAAQFRGAAPELDLGGSGPARELSELVRRMLQTDKAQRPGSAAEVRDTLRRLAEAGPSSALAESPTVAAPVQVLERALSRVSRVTTRVTGLRRLPLGAQRIKWIGAAVVVAMSAMLALGSDDDGATSMLDGAAVAADRAEREETPADSEPAKKVSSLEAAEKTLASERARDSQRRAAARAILQQKSDAPAHLLLIAELELTSRCSEKKELVLKLREQDDARALPALERLEATPKRGCGIVRLNDCLGCLRHELTETIAALRDD
jgi:serine/threonine-protein kinase